ncbi:unnamed protein product, partial [Staurois parvus]
MSPSSVFPGFHTGRSHHPHHYKSGDPIDIEFEVKSEEEEAYVRDDQQSMEEDGNNGDIYRGGHSYRDQH